MFPLLDHRGRVVGFGGRTLKDETPKYLNSPEGPLYQKGRLLYGLYQARKAIADEDEVIVVEGYTDVLALAQAGTGNVVASMGTALTDAQVNLMTRFTKDVTFMFDADRAGTEAMLRSGHLARSHSLRPMVAVLPPGKDPADLAVDGGKQAVAKVTAGKLSLLGFELRQTLARGDTSTADGRVRVFEEVRRIMAGASSLKEKEEEIPLLADQLRLTPESVALLLRGEGARPRKRATPGKDESALVQRLLGNEAAIEREFLVAAACNPEQAVEVLDALTPQHFADLHNREVFSGLREALALMTSPGDHEAALAALRARAGGGSEAGPLFVRLVIEADQGRYPPAVLEEMHLRLQEQYLMREIAVLRAGLDGGSEVGETQQRLLRLGRLLQSVRAGLIEIDPEEGRV